MRFIKSTAAALALSFAAFSFAGSAEAGHRWRHHHHNGGEVAAGIIGGLAVGAILGGAFTAPRVYAAPAPVYIAPAPVYTVPVYGPPAWTADWYAYCASKYRSFDPRSGTFLGYDGLRHMCR